MPRRKNNAPLLGAADARARSAMTAALALAHLHKHGGAVGRAHDQVDFSAAAPRRPIIALKQAQVHLLQILQRGVFRRIADLLGGARRDQRLDLRKHH